MKILVIDDEKTVLQGLDKLLRTARPDDAVVCYDDPFAATTISTMPSAHCSLEPCIIS